MNITGGKFTADRRRTKMASPFSDQIVTTAVHTGYQSVPASARDAKLYHTGGTRLGCRSGLLSDQIISLWKSVRAPQLTCLIYVNQKKIMISIYSTQSVMQLRTAPLAIP